MDELAQSGSALAIAERVETTKYYQIMKMFLN
jgi:hypothetical protein